MNENSHDTLDALLARYVAGALPLPAQVLVEAHLQIRPENRDFVRGMEDMAGAMMDSSRPIDLGSRDRRLQAIFASAPPADLEQAPGSDILPPVLRDFIGRDVADVPWRTKLPGFREWDIGEVDGCHVSLFCIRPGRRIPAHTHEGSELSLVLDGAFTDFKGRYGRGDISVADETVDHRPTAEPDRPCIGFSVTDAPLRLTGPLAQRLADIVGM
jgi:putative transcriptional regulator